MTTETGTADNGRHQETIDAAATSGVLQTLVIPAIAGLLLVVHFPFLNQPTWAPRVVLSGALGLIGMAAMPRLLRSAQRAGARLALCFVALATIAAGFSSRPLLSLLPSYDEAGSIVLVVAMVGAWAAGTTLDAHARRNVRLALLGGVAVNILVGLAQIAFDLGTVRLRAPFGMQGLLGNPVHLGALLAGATALFCERVRVEGWLWLPGVAAIGAALALSGSRVAAVAAVIVALAMALPLRRAGLPLILALVFGFLAAELIGGLVDLDRTTTADKVVTASGIQVDQRLDAWAAAGLAVVDEPMGAGPGRFVEISAPRTTLRLARSAPDTLYFDAHNLGFEYLATTGPLGLAAFAAFLISAVRRSSGAWRWCAIGILIVYVVQPQSLATIPIAFLAFGAGDRLRSEGRLSPIAGILPLTALAASIVLLLGDYRLREADLTFDRNTSRSASLLLSPWPEGAAQHGEVLIFHGATGGRSPAKELILDDAEQALKDAIQRDPAVPTQWNNLGDLQLYRGELVEATESFTEALERNPWSLRALVGAAAVWTIRGDADKADTFADRARHIDPEAATRAIGERTGAMNDEN